MVREGVWTLQDPVGHRVETLTSEPGQRSSFLNGVINSDLPAHTVPIMGHRHSKQHGNPFALTQLAFEHTALDTAP